MGVRYGCYKINFLAGNESKLDIVLLYFHFITVFGAQFFHFRLIIKIVVSVYYEN